MDGLCIHWDQREYLKQLNSSLIYKNECARCFATPSDSAGLDICLSCYVSGCHPVDGNEAEGHSLSHFQMTDHPIVMNVREVPHPADPNLGNIMN